MRRFIIIISLLFTLLSCRKEEGVTPSTSTQVGDGQDGEIKGFFLLNEGNMGSNKATLDYFDYTTGIYHRNIFAERNPDVVLELGDVGNDLKIWGERLYAVINCSNLVEVMDLQTARHLGQVSIPNCRYLAFKDGFAYVSSYAGALEDDSTRRLGYVAKVDTATLQVVSTCEVGYQPEELVATDGKLYVANSGGYNAPDYDNTISVIDLETFTLSSTIKVGINLNRMRLDDYGNLWVSSRGNYTDISSMVYVVSTLTDSVTECFETLPCSNMSLCGDDLYILSSQYNSVSQTTSTSYAKVDVKSQRITTRSFIADGTQEDITLPYGLAVNPETGDVVVTDAKNYLSSGKAHCYSSEGELQWSATTGDIPSSIVFTNKPLQDL